MAVTQTERKQRSEIRQVQGGNDKEQIQYDR